MISSAFQTIFTSLLVGLMLLGNAAAWIHHGTCHDVQCRVAKSEDKVRCGSSHCCHSHRAASPNDLVSFESSEPAHHDSNGCAACHSATTGGMSASLDVAVSPVCTDCVAITTPPVEIELQAVSLDQLHLRGPPVPSV